MKVINAVIVVKKTPAFPGVSLNINEYSESIMKLLWILKNGWRICKNCLKSCENLEMTCQIFDSCQNEEESEIRKLV